MEAVIAAHQRDEESEDRRLDEAGDDVQRLEELPGQFQIVGGVEIERMDAHHIAAEHADDIGDQHQDRQCDNAGDQARNDQVLVRVGRQGRERVDLFGHPHGADLRGDGGADPAGDHEAGEHRAELPRHREDDDGGDRRFRVQPGKSRVGLQREDHAGEDRRQADDRQRKITDLDHLPADRPPVNRRPQAVADGKGGERDQASGRDQKADKDTADRRQEIHPPPRAGPVASTSPV